VTKLSVEEDLPARIDGFHKLYSPPVEDRLGYIGSVGRNRSLLALSSQLESFTCRPRHAACTKLSPGPELWLHHRPSWAELELCEALPNCLPTTPCSHFDGHRRLAVRWMFGDPRFLKPEARNAEKFEGHRLWSVGPWQGTRPSDGGELSQMIPEGDGHIHHLGSSVTKLSVA
jgi:hypothetical protein